MTRLFLVLSLAAPLLAGTLSCSAYTTDRCYLPPERYAVARRLYDQAGSMKMVKETLREAGWRRAEINEAEYRMIEEMELDEP